MRLRFLSLFSVVVLFFTGCASKAPKEEFCHENRAAWDLGSGSVKVKAAKVNICELRIVQVLFEDTQKLGFKEDLEHSREKNFSESSMKSAREFIARSLEKLKTQGVSRHQAVATSAFRDAANGASFVESLNRDYHINVEVISQEREGELGYLAAQTQKPENMGAPPVWDIGGGSQQLSFMDQGRIKVFESSLASVGFKNQVLQKVKPKAKGGSPNPLTAVEIAQSLKLSEELSRQVVASFQGWFSFPHPAVLGIGGVHAASLARRLGKTTYTTADLEALLKKLAGLNDKALKSPYAATEVTNAILVLGMMRALKVDRVHIVKVNLTDGLLVYASYDPVSP